MQSEYVRVEALAYRLVQKWGLCHFFRILQPFSLWWSTISNLR